MFKNIGQAQGSVPKPRQVPLTFGPWPNGVVLSRQAEQMAKSELARGTNFITVEGGYQRTRNGTSLVLSGLDGECVWTGEVMVDGEWYTFAIDDNDGTYKLWFDEDDSGTATAIGALEGVAHGFGYLGYLISCDGGYAKSVTSMTFTEWATATVYALDDLVTNGNVGYRCIAAHTSGDTDDEPGSGATQATYWEATWLSLLYDQGTDGDGEGRPYQFNNRTGTAANTLALGNATNVRVAYKWTSQTLPAGQKLPPTVAYAKLSKTGAPTGSINMVIRKQSDGTAIITDVFLADVSTLTGDATEYTATFTPASRAEYFLSNTAYYLSLEYAAGDAGNYVNVHCSAVGGAAGIGAHYIAAWAADTDRSPIMGLKPGIGPKLVWGMVKDDRIFGIEGATGDHPAYLWYCAAGSAGNCFDWSTTDGGGYLTAIDSDGNTYAIGGVGEYYDNLYVFGTQRAPYLAVLSGASPSAWSLDKKLSKVYGHYGSILTTGQDIWFAHKGGIDAISTVETYGDIQAQKVSNRLHQKVMEKWDTAAFAGYDPDFGTLLVKLTGYDYVIAINTLIKASKQRGLIALPTAPANLWTFAWASENPTCFGSGNGCMLIGTDAGNVYKMDPGVVEDEGTAVTYQLWTNYPSTKFGELETDLINVNISGKFGGSYDVRFYRNHSRTELIAARISKVLPWDTSTEPDELAMDVAEMGFLVDPEGYYDRSEFDPFNFRSLMIGIENIVLNGAPLYIGEISLIANIVGGL